MDLLQKYFITSAVYNFKVSHCYTCSTLKHQPLLIDETQCNKYNWKSMFCLNTVLNIYYRSPKVAYFPFHLDCFNSTACKFSATVYGSVMHYVSCWSGRLDLVIGNMETMVNYMKYSIELTFTRMSPPKSHMFFSDLVALSD